MFFSSENINAQVASSRSNNLDKSSVLSLKTISMVKSCLDKPSVYRLKKNMDNENHNLYYGIIMVKFQQPAALKWLKKKNGSDFW